MSQDPTGRPREPGPDDPVLALNILRCRFLAVCLWFGAATRHWWAVVNGRLIEAYTPQELGRRIDLARADARGATPRPVRTGSDGPLTGERNRQRRQADPTSVGG